MTGRSCHWRELGEISGRGVEIGAHSHTHPELDTLPPHAQAEEARLPKLLLEKHLGVPVRSFAYPFGLYDRQVREAVAVAGYTAACTMNSWAATPGDHLLEVPRVAVFDDTDVEQPGGAAVGQPRPGAPGGPARPPGRAGAGAAAAHAVRWLIPAAGARLARQEARS